jgi:hypothetical protein
MMEFKDTLRKLVENGIGFENLFGEDFQLLIKAIPSLGKPLPKAHVDKSASGEAAGFTILGAANEPIFVKMPERFRRISSSMIVPHQTLVPVGKRKSIVDSRGIKGDTEPLLGFQFFKDLEILLDRQLHIESATMAILGDHSDEFALQDIKFYNFDEGVEFLWNEFTHLKLVQEPIVPQHFSDEVYIFFHDEQSTENDSKQKLKKLTSQLFHKYAVYIKAFTGHLRRLLWACREFPCNAIAVIAYLFGNLIFRTAMPFTDDKWVPPPPSMSVPFAPKIALWDSEEMLATPSVRKSSTSKRDSIFMGRNSFLKGPEVEQRKSLVVDGRRTSVFRDEKKIKPSVSFYQNDREDEDIAPLPEIVPAQSMNRGASFKLSRDKSRLKSFNRPPISLPPKRRHTLLYELPFLPPGKEPSQYNLEEREKFGWDLITKNDIRTLFEEHLVLSPFSKAVEVMLIHWDFMFSTGNTK